MSQRVLSAAPQVIYDRTCRVSCSSPSAPSSYLCIAALPRRRPPGSEPNDTDLPQCPNALGGRGDGGAKIVRILHPSFITAAETQWPGEKLFFAGPVEVWGGVGGVLLIVASLLRRPFPAPLSLMEWETSLPLDYGATSNLLLAHCRPRPADPLVPTVVSSFRLRFNVTTNMIFGCKTTRRRYSPQVDWLIYHSLACSISYILHGAFFYQRDLSTTCVRSVANFAPAMSAVVSPDCVLVSIVPADG
ncbi:hypothetical protein C8F04DRAFT_1269123 [Mycena alexandri]|uniref:Uncharacterized protein n=1 Tax=Mycena alexandri TaxID=1745969 RepID=A0AAD6SE06_9AGAR|nr:hypothetical protein C8F04DRAFT_1269123 [Mycena alexandri]